LSGFRLTLDNAIENSANSPLELSSPDGSLGGGILLMKQEYPPAESRALWARSIDTEGASRPSKSRDIRDIKLELRLAEPSDPASTNLVTNPDCAIDTTGWTNSSLSTMDRAILDTAGLPISVHEPGSDTALRCIGSANAQRAYASVPVTNGTTYTFAAYVYLGANTANGVRLSVYNATPTLRADSPTITTAGSWARYSVTFTADSSATWQVGLEQVGAGATTAYTTGACLEASSTVTAYFDGDTPGCSWTGAHQGSTSARKAPGGQRLKGIITDLQKSLQKIDREGGTLRLRPPSGELVTFDILDTNLDGELDVSYLRALKTTCNVTLTAKPWGRGPEITLPTHSETSLPAVIGVDAGIKGDASALGRLIVQENSGADQWYLLWGIQSRYYDSAASAALYWEAENLTPLGSAATAVGTATPSGSGSNVVRSGPLLTNYSAILSTQASPGGPHLSHIGDYRVFARVMSRGGNTGAVDVALQWAEGDFRRTTTNTPRSFVASDNRQASWCLLDLGQVHPTKAVEGPQRWEGRILARSTIPGDTIDIDYLFLVPVNEGSGVVRVAPQLAQPTTVSEQDAFNQAAGNLGNLSLGAAGLVAGPRNGGTFVDDSSAGNTAWSSPTNAGALDQNFASATFQNEGDTSHYLKATNFGFAVPSTATVTGIVVDVARYESVGTATVADLAVRIVKGGTIQSADRSNLSAPWPYQGVAYQSYGSANDLWGITDTGVTLVNDINASNFGFAIRANSAFGGHSHPGTVANIDHIRITVYYTDATGQTWATSGAATDIAVESGGHTAQRSKSGDAQPRFAIAGTVALTDTVARLDMKTSALGTTANGPFSWLIARYQDSSNYIYASLAWGTPAITVNQVIGGTTTVLLPAKTVPVSTGNFYTMYLVVFASGKWLVYFGAANASPTLIGQGSVGAIPASGQIGFADELISDAATRNYDNFAAWIPPTDAAIFASQQLEARYDKVIRQDSSASYWTPVTSYKGDLFLVPPAGREGRSLRAIVKGCRNDPTTMTDPNIDDLAYTIKYQPRYHKIPEV